jgi:hypothetical protein
MWKAARIALVAIAAASAAAMLYVGAYQIRAVRGLKCPLTSESEFQDLAGLVRIGIDCVIVRHQQVAVGCLMASAPRRCVGSW